MAWPSGTHAGDPFSRSREGWQSVETCLGHEEAACLRSQARDELSSSRFTELATAAMLGEQTARYDGHALIFLGPSAVGKTYAINNGILKDYLPKGALTLDGAIIRSASASWASAIALARDHGLLGFTDYFSKFFKAPLNEVKQNVFKKSIESKLNLAIPVTASDLASVLSLMEQLFEANYSVRFVAVYRERRACEENGRLREVLDGKKYDSKNWLASMQAILDIQFYLERTLRVPQTGNVIVFFNDGKFFSRLSISGLEHYLQWEEDQALPRSLCEIAFLCGTYQAMGSEGKELFELRPTSLTEKVVGVHVKKLPAGIALSDVSAGPAAGEEDDAMAMMSFRVDTCLLSTKNVEGDRQVAWELRLDSDGKACLTKTTNVEAEAAEISASGDGCGLPVKLEKVAELGKVGDHSSEVGSSLVVLPPCKDADLMAALGGMDFLRQSFRPLNASEYDCAAAIARLSGPDAAPSRHESVPKALVAVAPSGGGKTTVVGACAHWLDFDVFSAVVIDGAVFQNCHAQYSALIANGLANKSIWQRAWSAMKGVVGEAKERMLKAAIAAKQNVILTNTGSDVERLLQIILGLRNDGYVVSLCGIFANPAEIVSRGVARELRHGKTFNRDPEKLRRCFDAFAPVVRALNGKFCLVRNRDGRNRPELYMRGEGGSDIVFSLEEGLAWQDERIEEAELIPDDFRYIMEGNCNVVCAYIGSVVEWKGFALRCRKGDNRRHRRDVDFQRRVLRKLFDAEYVYISQLVSLSPKDAEAIDKQIFDLRPPLRRMKRIDTEVRDTSGRVLAMRVPNLLGSPLEGVCMLSVELKPKCGLSERQGFPCRYQLLQQQKLSTGKIVRVSRFDPVKLLSGDVALALEALDACMDEPQNNLRVFIDDKAVFSEETIKQHQSRTAESAGVLAKSALQVLDTQLLEAGLPDKAALTSVVALLLGSSTLPLPKQLKRIQCWAAGETATLAEQLYDLIKDHAEGSVEDILYHPDTFDLAVEDLDAYTCDETGNSFATKEMRAVLHRAKLEAWSSDTKREAIRWVCRFLLGRMAMDASVIVNFVRVPEALLTPSNEDILRSFRFQLLDSVGLPIDHPCAALGFWFRMTLIDTDIKPAVKIPEYARQLDELTRAYLTRCPTQSA
eukprot:TRINITY_DN55908_c0_g1_i1.p1 TRINITY_DN55908_c0_g1~~TRINITY_DN55908_c0_g1_i1.p1  ORF type:complete len:1135 (-),score=175.71 TRINITY_DN55908_c0_g1_i1:206-3610(-)